MNLHVKRSVISKYGITIFSLIHDILVNFQDSFFCRSIVFAPFSLSLSLSPPPLFKNRIKERTGEKKTDEGSEETSADARIIRGWLHKGNEVLATRHV